MNYDKMNPKEILTEFNLSEKEVAVYLAALQLGSSSVATIATKATVQRTHAYDISRKLIALGFIKQIFRGKKKVLSAVAPEAIIKMEEQKLLRLKATLPEFKALYSSKGNRPRISYYEGKRGIEQINDDTLQYKSEIVAFTTPRFYTYRSKSTGRTYINKRMVHGNTARVIGEDSPEMRALQETDHEDRRETRIVSPSQYQSDVEIGMYANKMYVIDYAQEFGLIIESQEITKTMKAVFEMVWDKWRT